MALLVLTVGVLLRIEVIYWKAWNPTGFGTDTENVSLADAQRYGKFKLPPGATGFRAHLTGFQDYYLQVRFSMPPDALYPFLASTIVAQPLPAGGTVPYQFNHGPSAPSWWTPGKSSSFLTGTSPDNNKVMQYILIDQSDPENYGVYLVAHDM